MPRKHALAVFETLTAIFLWGVSFAFIKILLREVSPVTVITLRFAVGALALAGAAVLRGEFTLLRWGDLPRMALLGAVGITLQQMLQVTGQVSAQAGVAAFLASTAPAFLVLLAAVFLGERVNRWQVWGVILATAGAGVVSSGGDWRALWEGRIGDPGNGLVLLSAIVWAVFSILNRHFGQDRPALLLAGGMMFFGSAFTLPLFIARQGWLELANLSPAGWGAFAYVAGLSTALAYLLYTHALKQAEASRLAAVQNFEPLFAVAAAALMLGEAVTWSLLVGGVAILVGISLAERRSRDPSPQRVLERDGREGTD